MSQDEVLKIIKENPGLRCFEIKKINKLGSTSISLWRLQKNGLVRKTNITIPKYFVVDLTPEVNYS